MKLITLDKRLAYSKDTSFPNVLIHLTLTLKKNPGVKPVQFPKVSNMYKK